MCKAMGALNVAPHTDVNTVTGNSSQSDHSVKDSTNTEINVQVTTSFVFLLLSSLILLLLVLYWLWSKRQHRVLHDRIHNLAFLTGHHPDALASDNLREIITVNNQSQVGDQECSNVSQL